MMTPEIDISSGRGNSFSVRAIGGTTPIEIVSPHRQLFVAHKGGLSLARGLDVSNRSYTNSEGTHLYWYTRLSRRSEDTAQVERNGAAQCYSGLCSAFVQRRHFSLCSVSSRQPCKVTRKAKLRRVSAFRFVVVNAKPRQQRSCSNDRYRIIQL